MEPEEFARIQKEGANARAINGPNVKRNPYYDTDRMPGATGESLEQWQKKAEAWELGWSVEHALR